MAPDRRSARIPRLNVDMSAPCPTQDSDLVLPAICDKDPALGHFVVFSIKLLKAVKIDGNACRT